MSSRHAQIVVTRDGVVVHGHEHLARKREVGETHAEMIVLQVDYHTADEATRDRLWLLSTGLKMDEERGFHG